MILPKNTDLVLRNLVDLWTARLPVIHEFLRTTFGYLPVGSLEVTRLFIAQMADGDLSAGNIGGVYMLKWVLTGDVLEAVPLDYAYDEMYETDQSGDVYRSPSYLFFNQGEAVLLSERYGPSLKHRLRGKLVNIGQRPTIEWVTVWRSTVG